MKHDFISNQKNTIMLEKIKSRFHRENFLPSALSVVINPKYIIRNGLYQGVKQLAPKLGGDILDFGCGSKPYESLFLNAKSYVGVDIEVSGHSHADSKVDFFYDGKRLPFSDNSFESVVCFEVLEHVFNIDEVLSEISRVLKPNGCLLVTVPFAWDEHEIPYDFARYTSFGISNVLERNGFKILELKKSTTSFLAICQLLIAYLTQYVLPNGPKSGKVAQLVCVFPLTVLSLILNKMFPKRVELFCNSIVLAKKSS
jgi:ubiquinone/menaquinone biosynthesis C-methylase UbiE